MHLNQSTPAIKGQSPRPPSSIGDTVSERTRHMRVLQPQGNAFHTSIGSVDIWLRAEVDAFELTFDVARNPRSRRKDSFPISIPDTTIPLDSESFAMRGAALLDRLFEIDRSLAREIYATSLYVDSGAGLLEVKTGGSRAGLSALHTPISKITLPDNESTVFSMTPRGDAWHVIDPDSEIIDRFIRDYPVTSHLRGTETIGRPQWLALCAPDGKIKGILVIWEKPSRITSEEMSLAAEEGDESLDMIMETRSAVFLPASRRWRPDPQSMSGILGQKGLSYAGERGVGTFLREVHIDLDPA